MFGWRSVIIASQMKDQKKKKTITKTKTNMKKTPKPNATDRVYKFSVMSKRK